MFTHLRWDLKQRYGVNGKFPGRYQGIWSNWGEDIKRNCC